jgi:hypothetical protein
LGLVISDSDAGPDAAAADTARYGEFGPRDELRLTGPAIDGEDVRRMSAFLERYRGDLRTLVDGPGGPQGSGSTG